MSTFVVIVTFNGSAWIDLALDSLRRSQAACTTIVVDNASTDGTRAIIERDFPEVQLLPQSRNVGFGVGNNVGISHAIRAGAEFIFLLNQDAYVTTSTIAELVGFLRGHPDFGLVSPLHCRPDLSRVDLVTLGWYLQRNAPQYLSDACVGSIKEFYEIHGVNAAAWMARASTFKVAGGFDPLFFMYGEDDDMMARFSYLGQKFALLPASRIVHLRAKAARPKVGVFGELWALAERARSQMLLDAKRPTGRAVGKIGRLLVNGLAMSLQEILGTHNWRRAISYPLATISILLQFKRIVTSAKRCATPGPHYLDIKA